MFSGRRRRLIGVRAVYDGRWRTATRLIGTSSHCSKPPRPSPWQVAALCRPGGLGRASPVCLSRLKDLLRRVIGETCRASERASEHCKHTERHAALRPWHDRDRFSQNTFTCHAASPTMQLVGAASSLPSFPHLSFPFPPTPSPSIP